MQQSVAITNGERLMNIASSVHAFAKDDKIKKTADDLFKTGRLIVSEAMGHTISYSIEDNFAAMSKIGRIPAANFLAHQKEIVAILKILVTNPRIYTDAGKTIVIPNSRVRRIKTLMNKI